MGREKVSFLYAIACWEKHVFSIGLSHAKCEPRSAGLLINKPANKSFSTSAL